MQKFLHNPTLSAIYVRNSVKIDQTFATWACERPINANLWLLSAIQQMYSVSRNYMIFVRFKES